MFGWFRESSWRVPALLFFFTLFFYWKILFTNRYMFPWDTADFFYPYLAFVHEELRHFRFPLWNPYSMSGYPIIGDPEAQIFYPPNWLLVLLHPFSPLTFKWVEAMEIAHFFLAGLFLFWLARDFTKNTLSALLGGVLYMSSGAMVAHTEHVATVEAMTWYPLVFLLARRGLVQKSWCWSISAGLFLGIENLTGHWQHAVYLGLLLFLYFAYEACAGPLRRHLWPHWIIHLLAIGAIGAGLAMIQVIPAAELSAHSIRTQLTYWDVTQGNDPRYLWTLFLPNYFGGLNGVPYLEAIEPSFNYVFLTVPGCLLALLGLIEMARRRNYFWLGLILLTVELSFGRNGHVADLIYRIPLLNLFRQMPVYFDLGNLGLCLMAAVGMNALIDPDTRSFYRRWLPASLAALAVFGAGWGLIDQRYWKIPGWYHMLAVLALFGILVTAWLRQQLSPKAAQWAILFLVGFELCQYSMNQVFNWSIENPRTLLSYDYAAHRKESLEFLRSDGGSDFRVAAIDDSPWGSNGCMVWRIPCIFGWNPLMLRSYREYIRQFIDAENYALPWGETDHHLDSPLLDLLGVKYLLIIDPDAERLRLAASHKFEKVFVESEWRSIYRNQNYFSRTWFYPRAYTLRDPAQLLALMNSRWFQARRTLLFAQSDLPAGLLPTNEPLETITLYPANVVAASGAAVIADNNCYEARQLIADWKGKGSWVRFDMSPLTVRGRYVLLVEYTAPYEVAPVFDAEIQQGELKVSSPVTALPRTNGWSCSQSRSAELGQFELVPGTAQLTLTLHQDYPPNVYTLWMVRLPDEASGNATPSPATASARESSATPAAVIPSGSEESAFVPPKSFSFRDFDVSANRYAFRADLEQDGFVLVNELYYPGWEATVNGQPADILRADHIFRALALPAGSHQIEMRFRPRRFWLGAAVSLLTLAALLAYFSSWRRGQL